MDTSKNRTSRREFLRRSSAVGLGAVIVPSAAGVSGLPLMRLPSEPVVIASANGIEAIKKVYDVIQGGGSTLDGIIAGVDQFDAGQI